MNKNIVIGVIVVVILAAGGIIAYKSMKPSETMAPSPDNSMMAASPASNDAMMGSDASMSASMSATEGAVKEFTVTGSNYKFEPSTLTVNKGDKVKITFKNSGGFHNWMLDEFSAKSKTIQSGATDTVEFTADKVGSFEYYCGVGNHRAMGMKGTLTVQ